MEKEKIISELQRVAQMLGTARLTRREFSQHSHIGVSTVRDAFGTWNEAVQAAGLEPIPSGGLPELRKQPRPDDEYLREIIRLTQELGKRPVESQLASKGRFSVKPYRDRWGTFRAACKVAYAKYGFPDSTKQMGTNGHACVEATCQDKPATAPQTYRPGETQSRKRVLFGEPIDFRGLRFAPINEQGVVYLFGMVSRELGFLVESIRTDYPDCEGKRCVDASEHRWEQVRIEFEYQSINFRDHGHRSEDCDLIVCWIHDWEDCPIEVLELRSQIKYLPSR